MQGSTWGDKCVAWSSFSFKGGKWVDADTVRLAGHVNKCDENFRFLLSKIYDIYNHGRTVPVSAFRRYFDHEGVLTLPEGGIYIPIEKQISEDRSWHKPRYSYQTSFPTAGPVETSPCAFSSVTWATRSSNLRRGSFTVRRVLGDWWGLLFIALTPSLSLHFSGLRETLDFFSFFSDGIVFSVVMYLLLVLRLRKYTTFYGWNQSVVIFWESAKSM